MHPRNRLVAVLPFVVVPFACASESGDSGGYGSPSTSNVGSTTTGNPTVTSAGTDATTSSVSSATTTGAGGQTVTSGSTDTTTSSASSVTTTGMGGQTVAAANSSDSATTGAEATSGAGVGGGVGGGGASSTGQASTTGGDPGEPNASPGCGQSGRPNGGQVYVNGESWLLFPESYDGNTPLPVLFGFHGCGSGNRGDSSRTEYTDLTRGTAFESEYVRAIPVSSDAGGCWNYNTDITRVKALYDDLVNNYCVDVDRVFATGHSSGAQLIVQILTTGHTQDAETLNFRGVAPVAASSYGALGTVVPVMYIQNTHDQERGSDGKDAVDQFVAANGCSSTSTPLTVAGAGCQSSGTTVDPNCISYDGCDVPTIWCSHNDPQYSNTGHGVPCFAAEATDEFFKSL